MSLGDQYSYNKIYARFREKNMTKAKSSNKFFKNMLQKKMEALNKDPMRPQFTKRFGEKYDRFQKEFKDFKRQKEAKIKEKFTNLLINMTDMAEKDP